jgi:hypothetical protein
VARAIKVKVVGTYHVQYTRNHCNSTSADGTVEFVSKRPFHDHACSDRKSRDTYLLLLTEVTLTVVPIVHSVPRGKRYMCDGATAVPSSSSLHMFLLIRITVPLAQ